MPSMSGLEVARQEAYAGLAQQVRSLGETQERLRGETANLVTALRAPAVRGRWGELQLRRVVELAGMVRHCDFVEQATVSTEDGRQRPDLVVNLQSKSSWNALGAQIANLGPVLWKPFSRGQVTLASGDARQYPLVEFNFVADARDLARMKYGFRFVVDLLASEAVRPLIGKPFPVRFTDRLRQLNQKTTASANFIADHSLLVTMGNSAPAAAPIRSKCCPARGA